MRSISLVPALGAGIFVFCFQQHLASAEVMIGSGSVQSYIVKHITASDRNLNCTIKFLQDRAFSADPECGESNEYLREIFKAKKLSTDDPSAVKAVEGKIIEFLVDRLKQKFVKEK